MADGSNRHLSAADAFNVTTRKGVATFSGQLSGEVVIGPEVNFAFRMEKLAKDLGLPRLLSATAAARLPRRGKSGNFLVAIGYGADPT